MSKSISVHKNSKVTDKIADHLDDLINYSAPVDIRNRILHVYLEYIIHKFEELPIDFQEIALDFNFLIDFFNRIDTELKAEQLPESEQK
ncbi:MAG: hypothetical protein R8G66_01135 [Cytophagales bacterium]|nr:hypothetical protein [Cytophagales bacterium]